MGSSEETAGRGQSLFRDVNERVRALAADDLSQFICECANLRCVEPMSWQPQKCRLPIVR